MTHDVDQRELRCPKLGGPVSFRYCLECGTEDLPCHKTIDCWWEVFDVVAEVRARLPEEKFEKLMALREKPQEKITSLLDLIDQAKKRVQSDDSGS